MTREEAIKRFKRMKKILSIPNSDAERTIEAIDMAIEALQEPSIVRCKDCKYMTEHYDTDGNAPYWTCSEWDSGTDYDGFCHYAERKK